MVEAITFQQLSDKINSYLKENHAVLCLWLDCALKIQRMGNKGNQVKMWRTANYVAEKQLMKTTSATYTAFTMAPEYTKLGEALIERYPSDNMKNTVAKKFEHGGKCFMIMTSMFARYLTDMSELLIDLENHPENNMQIAAIVKEHCTLLDVMRGYLQLAMSEMDLHRQSYTLLAVIGKVFGYDVVQDFQQYVPESEGQNFQLFLSERFSVPPKRPAVRNALLRRKLANAKMQELKPTHNDK